MASLLFFFFLLLICCCCCLVAWASSEASFHFGWLLSLAKANGQQPRQQFELTLLRFAEVSGSLRPWLCELPGDSEGGDDTVGVEREGNRWIEMCRVMFL